MSNLNFSHLQAGEQADICLLLEGTYPYVRGGVSSWLHQLIQGLPQYSFALIFVGANPDFYEEAKYEFPSNVCHFEAHYLTQPPSKTIPRSRSGDKDWFHAIDHLHRQFKTIGANIDQTTLEPFILQLRKMSESRADDFFHSTKAWEFMVSQYEKNCPDLPFNEYFWTIRSMHTPLFTLLDIAKNAPPAGVYHTISTGYAGVLGFFLRVLYNRPLLLTEHGIYTKERHIDLYQAEWIREPTSTLPVGLHGQISYIRRLWGKFFEGLGRLTYCASNDIISLFHANRRVQIDYGADPQRCRVIANGVDIARFQAAREHHPGSPLPVMGLIGRVVPIKDIKTFIRAAGQARQKMPGLKAWIVGGEDEDPKYAAECHALVDSMNLHNTVKFLGFQSVDAIMPHLGVVVLSSISEGQPLSVLEAYAAGIPVVVTDVGSCRELVEGSMSVPEDLALGHAGAVVPLASPAAMADAVISLLGNPQAWHAARDAAITRVETFYTSSDFLNHYDILYKETLEHGRNRV